MAVYILKRLGFMVVTLWIIVSLTFIMMHAVPGDPFSNEKMTPAVLSNLKAKYGLDKPQSEQYVIYLNNLLHGDLGVSMRNQTRTVNEVIREHFPVSAQLGFWSLLYSVPGGIALGVVAALKRNKWQDRSSMVASVLGISVPGFVFATLLQLLLGVMWQKWTGKVLLPVGGWGDFKHVWLPSFCLGVGVLAGYARMMRSSMLDVLNQDYIKTARSKGLSGREVVWRHAIRNAILPIVTLLGTTVVGTLLGSLVIEQIFAIPGLGRYFVQSITNSDYTMILGTTVFYGALLIFALFFVDIAYGLVDPRIRLGGGKS
jgi:ABC-type dipeptide/oligopeptide/nickel transport system permease component